MCFSSSVKVISHLDVICTVRASSFTGLTYCSGWLSQLQQTVSEKDLSHCRQVNSSELSACTQTHIPHLELTTLWRTKHILWHWHVQYSAMFVFDFALYVELKQTGRRVGGVWLEWITFLSPACPPPMYVSLFTRAEKQKHKETERKRKREVPKFNKCLSNQKSNTKPYLGRWIVNTVHSLWENTLRRQISSSWSVTCLLQNDYLVTK